MPKGEGAAARRRDRDDPRSGSPPARWMIPNDRPRCKPARRRSRRTFPIAALAPRRRFDHAARAPSPSTRWDPQVKFDREVVAVRRYRAAQESSAGADAAGGRNDGVKRRVYNADRPVHRREVRHQGRLRRQPRPRIEAGRLSRRRDVRPPRLPRPDRHDPHRRRGAEIRRGQGREEAREADRRAARRAEGVRRQLGAVLGRRAAAATASTRAASARTATTASGSSRVLRRTSRTT